MWLVFSVWSRIELHDQNSRGVKRQNGNTSLPSKTYFPKALTQNIHGFQYSFAEIKNRYPLSGLKFVRKLPKL